MNGQNEILMNEATIKAALQYYLNGEVLKSPCIVSSVKSSQTASGGYTVKFSQPADKEEKK